MPTWNGYGGGFGGFGDDQGFGSYGGTLGGFSGGFDSGAAAAAGAGLSAGSYGGGYSGGYGSGYGGMAGSPAGRGVGSSKSSSSSVGAGLSSGGYGGYSGGSTGGYSGGGYSGGMAGSTAGRGVGSSGGYGGGLSGGMGGFGGSNSDHGFGGSIGGMAGSPAGQGVGGMGGLGGGSNSDHSFGGSIGGMMGSPAGVGVGSNGGFGGFASNYGGRGPASVGGTRGNMGGGAGGFGTGYGDGYGDTAMGTGAPLNNATRAYRDLMGRGYSRSVAAAKVGNWNVESPGLNPSGVGDLNLPQTAYGIQQWRDVRPGYGRKSGLKQTYGPNPNLSQQIDYSEQEQAGTAAVRDPQSERFGRMVASDPQMSVDDATRNFMNLVERPNRDPNINRIGDRMASAQNVMGGPPGYGSGVIAGNEGTPTLASAGGDISKPYQDPAAQAPIDMTRANPIPSPIGFHGYPQARSRSPYVGSARTIAQATTGTPVPQSGDPMSVPPSAHVYSPGRIPGTIMQSPVDSPPLNTGQVPSGIMQGQSPAPIGYGYSPDASVSVGSIHSPIMQGQSPDGLRMQPAPFDAPTYSHIRGDPMAAKSQGPGPGWVDMGTRHTDTFGVYENTPMTAREKLAAALSGKSDHMFINRGAKRNKLPMKKAKPK